MSETHTATQAVGCAYGKQSVGLLDSAERRREEAFQMVSDPTLELGTAECQGYMRTIDAVEAKLPVRRAMIAGCVVCEGCPETADMEGKVCPIASAAINQMMEI